MRVIGIDPGTRSVGYGVVEEVGGRYVRCDSGAIECRDKELANRLVGIHRGLQVVIREWKPDLAAIETAFFGKNPQTAIKIGEGRGVAMLSAAEAEVEVVGVEPALVKRALTGNGRASKDQVAEMVRVLLGLEAAPETDHESDALAMAVACLQRTRQGLPLAGKRELPPAVVAALGGKAPKRRAPSRRRK
ncbi:MAG: crossover junction endodeoxyribonuclease RuvC [Planctomycetota bacterium]|jgi:crossover junction endodeoxyribonuclease RuvC